MEKLYDRLENAMKDAGFYIDAFVEDFLLKNGATAVQTDITDAFDSYGYDCHVLSVAWVDAEGLHLKTWLLEVC